MTAAARIAAVAALVAALGASTAAQAHRAWLHPSATILSGTEPWVTIDGAISNTLYVPDHNPMRVEDVKAIGPDGAPVALENAATGKYRSTFDVKLAAPGTYKIYTASETTMASYTVGTEQKRWRGRAADLAAAVPKDATDLKVTTSVRRIETFVTSGAPTTAALKTTGQGLELEPISHPNDLVVSEKARFKLLLDGKPASGVEVEFVLGDQKYRDKAPEWKVTTAADGTFEAAWPEPGLYWLEASARGQDAAGAGRNLAYIATLEVLPD